MNKRILKQEKLSFKGNDNEIASVQPNTKLLHPLFLLPIGFNNESMCLTKFHVDNNNKISTVKPYNCAPNNDNNKYNKYLYTPPIGFVSSDILEMYKINSIDSLVNWIDDNYETKNLLTLNRIVNCWIRQNIDLLLQHSTLLGKIIIKLLLIYNKMTRNIVQNNETEINKDVKKYIEYWITKNKEQPFYMDLLEDLVQHIKKKY